MTYLFGCTNPKCKCNGEHVEVECSMKDYDTVKDTLACSECGEKLSRVWEKFEGGIEFKGNGFYNTENNVVAKWQ